MDPRTPSCIRKSLDNDNFCHQDVEGGLNSSSSTGGAFKTTEEIISELRRENFRLRLMCFDYEKARKRMINPQDAESSRLFSVEAENLTLKEVLAEKTNLLRSASKTISALKEENNLLNEKLHEWEEKLHDNNASWRRQYDALYRQLQQANDVIQSETHKREDSGRLSDLTSRISEPGGSPTTNKTEADQGHLRTTQLFSELEKSTSAQQQVGKGASRLVETDVFELSRDIHRSCELRFQEVCEVVYALIKQLNDAGLAPAATIRSDLLLLDRSNVVNVTSKKNPHESSFVGDLKDTPLDALVNDRVTNSIDADLASFDHVSDSGATISWLSERLNAARRLILDLGNHKLRQDALIAQLQGARRLSTSGVLHSMSVQPVADVSLPKNLGIDDTQCSANDTPARADSIGEIAEPHSLTRLRDLYRLVHELQAQLENVRFTQHSFVELINRSLCTSGLDVSLLLSPCKRDLAVSGSGNNVAVGTSGSLVSDNLLHPSPNSVEAGNSQLSQAHATDGRIHALSETLNETREHSSVLRACDIRPLPDSSLNQTVCDLKNLPSSPTSLTQATRPTFSRIFQPTKPLPVDHPTKPMLPPMIPRLRTSKYHESASFSEGATRLHSTTKRAVNHLSNSFTLDYRLDSGPAVGDVTLVEWQNRQLFERLARATAALRDVLVECTEVGSHLLTTELSQSLIQYLSTQADEPAALVGDSHSIDRTPTLTTPVAEDDTQNRSVRFDRVDPHLAPSDFTELSGSSFSHLYDPEWRGLETTLSEQGGNKISVDTRTNSSRPTTTAATDVSTQTVSETSDVVVCHRFVSLLLHALTVLHRAVQGIATSFDSTPLSAPPESYCDGACSTWWVSWIQSATHWFQSFLDALNVLDGSKSTDSTIRFRANKDEINSLLECLERVFNERVDVWIADIEHTLQHLEHRISSLRFQNERMSDELKQSADHKCRLETRVTELETELDDLLNLSVPLDEHRTVVQQLTKLEEQVIQGQQFCEHLENERRQLRTLVPDDIADAHAVHDLIGQVQVVCSELVAQRQNSSQLQRRYEASLEECSELKQRLAQCLGDFDKQSTDLKQQFDSQLFAAREDMQAKVAESSRLASELELYRSKQEQLTLALESREAEMNHLLQQLSELQENVRLLQTSLAAKSDSARMAADSAAAHEQYARTLTLELEHLRKEHALCSIRPVAVNTQTSPTGLSKSVENMHAEVLEKLPSVDKSDDCRARKYGELKAVAFEIKEKLLRRTDKLEVALTEIARLRSIIQQDKEHASHVLEEVEDLRKQAIRKNRRIHELEAELMCLKKCAVSTGLRASLSPARTVSEVEQPRGPQHCMNASLFESTAAVLSHAASVNEPTAQSVNALESVTPDHSDACPTGLLLVSPFQLPERESEVLLSSNSRRELSCPSHISEPVASPIRNTIASNQRQFGTTQLLSDLEKPLNYQHRTGRKPSRCDVTDILDPSSVIHRSCRHLHRTRSRLQHYASEMDRMCCVVLQRLDDAWNNCESSKTLVQRAEHCQRRYRKLTQGIDSFANELSQTADILATTRSNLEHATGLSLSSERATMQSGRSGLRESHHSNRRTQCSNNRDYEHT